MNDYFLFFFFIEYMLTHFYEHVTNDCRFWNVRVVVDGDNCGLRRCSCARSTISVRVVSVAIVDSTNGPHIRSPDHSAKSRATVRSIRVTRSAVSKQWTGANGSHTRTRSIARSAATWRAPRTTAASRAAASWAATSRTAASRAAAARRRIFKSKTT